MEMKKLLFVGIVSTVVIAGISGCSSSSDTAAALDLTKPSVALSDISQNSVSVTYELVADKSTHTDKYCPNGDLGTKGVDGTWSIEKNGNDLLVTPITGTAYQYQTTNAKLDVNSTYTTTTSEIFKVTKIETTICL